MKLFFLGFFHWLRFMAEAFLRPIPYGTGVFLRRIFYRVFFGKDIRVSDHAFITHIHKIEIDPTSLIGRCSDINACGGLKIGKYVGMGPYVVIRTNDHQYRNRDMKKNRTSFVFAPVTIGDGAWIGANTCILKGVEIGEHAVVGAGSVVTKSIPACSLAVGNPAKVVKTFELVD
jgi:maltose O-acetyltransferase